MRIQADKIASVTRRITLARRMTLANDIMAQPGSVIAARVLNDKHTYHQLEDAFGRLNVINSGDIIVGALGHRNALHGYEGIMPESVAVGDRLHLLNLGGVIGHCVSHNPEVGQPFELEVLGQVLVYLDFQSRRGVPACVSNHAIMVAGELPGELPNCPVIYVAGTCMNSGKTAAASRLVKGLCRAGLRVAGVKLTGVSLLRDTLLMRDHGAEWVMDFTDAGVVTTGPDNAANVAHTLFRALAAMRPDVIVAETGDGVMGEYGVQEILADESLRQLIGAFVFCANDPVGVAGGVNYLQQQFGIEADVITGPATDNQVGIRFIHDQLGIPAHNARLDAGGLLNCVHSAITARKGKQAWAA